MKSATLWAALIFALPLPGHAISEDDRQLCRSLHGLAGTVMELRQAGASMPALVEAATKELSREMIRQAYREPRYNTQAHQHRAIRDFANHVYAQCLDAYD